MNYNFIKYRIVLFIVITAFFSSTELNAQCTLQVFTNLVNDDCQGGGNGAVSAVGIFGTQPYTAVWTNSSGAQVKIETGLIQGQATTPTNLISGLYTVTFTDATSTCIISKDISVNNINIDTTTNFNNGTITSNQTSGTTYRWLDCNNGMTVIPGETDVSFTPILNGSYAVELTKFGCVDISACVIVNTLDVKDNVYLKYFSIHPNPTSNILNIKMNQGFNKAEIYNLQGQKVLESNTKKINVSKLSSGMYLLKVKSEFDGEITKRFIKE